MSKLYHERVEKKLCTRCGTAHTVDWSLKKCDTCKTIESEWRKKTRANRRDTERKYCIKHWFNRCCYLSKTADKKYNRVSSDPYITPERLKTLRVLQLNQCFYCHVNMNVQNRRQPTGLSIERICNKKPHTHKNIILCCHQCNVRKISNKDLRSNDEIFFEIFERFENNPLWKEFRDRILKNYD